MKQKLMEKAQIFTFDAFFALILAIFFLSLMPMTLNTYKTNDFEILRLHDLALEELAVMERTGTFNEIMQKSYPQSQEQLQTFLETTLPPEFSATASVSTYLYKEGLSCTWCNANGSVPVNEFCFCGMVNASVGSLGNNVGAARRLDMKNTKQDQYMGIAEIRVSRK